MLLAAYEKDGVEHVIIGLEEENIRNLENDMPIARTLTGIAGVKDGTRLFILGPEDTVRFVAQYGADKIQREPPG